MQKNCMQESAISADIKRQTTDTRFRDFGVKDFIATYENGFWVVRFTFLNSPGYELHLKRGGIRPFKSLNALAECLKKMGVAEYKVVLI